MTGKTWAFEDFVEGGSIDLGAKDCDGGRDHRIRQRIRSAADASRRGGRQGQHPRRPVGLRLAYLRDVHAPALRRVPAQFDFAGRAGHRPDQMEEAGAGRRPPDGRTTVLARRESKSRPSIGLVTMRSELFNQRGEAVFELENTVMFLKREAARMTPRRVLRASASPRRSARTHSRRRHQGLRQEIRSAAVSYRRGGGEEERLRRALRVGLADGGDLDEAQPRDARPAAGRGPVRHPVFGPSPGISNLKWLKPVYAGETVSFSRTALSHRAMASRPGWRMLTVRAEGIDSTGAKVIEFDSAVLVKVD